MKNIKDITLLAFAVIGFYTIITAFSSTESNQPQQVYATPESHVWEIAVSSGNYPRAYTVNKITGEVRKFDSRFLNADEKKKDNRVFDYVVMKEKINNK